MAIDGFMAFKLYDNSFLLSETAAPPLDRSPLTDDASIIGYDDAVKARALFQIDSCSFDVEQTLNIGSQSSGSGAGRITFNPFGIVRSCDQSSPRLFEMSCSGTPFKFVTLWLRKPNPGKSGFVYMRFDWKLVAVKTIAWSSGDGASKESITFEYGGLQIRYVTQNPDGSFKLPVVVGGWNRVKNMQDQTANPL